MVKILTNLPAAVQAAQAVTTIPTATRLAQQVLASTAKLTGATKSLAAWKLDAAGNLLIRSADGSYLPLDQLVSGPLLPGVLELGNLEVKSTVLDLGDTKALAALAELRAEKLAGQLSPAEFVQYALRYEDDYPFNIDIPVRPLAMGPDGSEVNIAQLEFAPRYPLVEERIKLSILQRVARMMGKSQLADFYEAKGEILAAKMSEAECLQFWFLSRHSWTRPSSPVDLLEQLTDASGRAWTLEQLKAQPLSAAVRRLDKWVWTGYRAGAAFDETRPAVDQAYLLLESYAAQRQVIRLLPQLSDAELFQYQSCKI